MYYLATFSLAPGYSLDDLAPMREAEDDAVRALVATGLVVLPFFRTDKPAAVFLMRGSESEVRAAAANLPAVKAGIVPLTELIPLVPHAAHPAA